MPAIYSIDISADKNLTARIFDHMTRAMTALRLSLSSGRHYVFAADLFDALVATTQAQAPSHLRLARLTNEALDLRHDTPQPENPDFAGTFTYRIDHQELNCWITRRSGDVITDRSAVEDRTLLAAVHLQEDGADAATAGQSSLCKAAMVLAVLWLEEAYPTLVWNLAKLKVEGPFHGSGELRIRRSRYIGRFLQVHVWFQNQYWGEFLAASSPYIQEAHDD